MLTHPPAPVVRLRRPVVAVVWWLLLGACSAKPFRGEIRVPAKSRPAFNQTNTIYHPTSYSTWGPADGFCVPGQNVSLWHRFPDAVCSKTVCMYSPALQHGVMLPKLPQVKISDISIWERINSFANCQVSSSVSPSSEAIVVISFIFTVHNSAAMAARCILDIFSTILEIREATEIVLVDDASDEDMSEVFGLLEKIKALFGYRVTVIKSPTNLGYGASNNLALRAARGKYALLLNSDILVNPGWLAAMLHTMRTYPRAGMVGPMMVGVDGIVKEAGGLVYRGGQPANFGRGLKPQDVPYLHARAVDYISAACLLVRRQLFLDLGLFDPQFEPAYYEDTDAALVHLRAGWLTVLQPLAVVTHAEGASISSKAKDDLMSRNRKLFSEKHRSVLDNFCPGVDPSCAHVPYCAGETYSAFVRDGPHLLVLEKHFPETVFRAESVRLTEITNLFKSLGYKVSMEAETVRPTDDAIKLSLLAEGVYVHPQTMLQSLVKQKLKARSVAIRCPWDIIYASYLPHSRSVMDNLKLLCPDAPVIFDATNINMSRNPLSEYAEDKDRLHFMQTVDATLVASQLEQHILRGVDGSIETSVLPCVYPSPQRVNIAPLSTRSGSIYVCDLCQPSDIDTLKFIIAEIAPVVKKGKFDALKITVVLSNSEQCEYAGIADLAKDLNMELHFNPTSNEVLMLYNRARMAIAPIRVVTGVSSSIYSALLHGVPVVSMTAMAAEMHLVGGKSVVLGDDRLGFMTAMEKISHDNKLWFRLQKGGWNVIENYFSRSAAHRVLSDTITKILKLPLPAWGDGVENPVVNLRACPQGGSAAALPQQCQGCWHCPLNEHFYYPPVVRETRRFC